MAWWKPDELKRSEEQARGAPESIGDVRNDFVSYRKALLGQDADASQIGTHNDLNPDAKIQSILSVADLGRPSLVLDAGCGLGYTTSALARAFPDATVVGVDISRDAIEFASQHFPEAQFQAHTVAAGEPPVGQFDAIFCFEFYPYSRNRDVQFQAGVTEWLSDQLFASGVIVIYQRWNNPDSLSAVLPEVAAACPDLAFSVRRVPHPKTPRWLPLWLRYAASAAIDLTGREGVRRIVFVRRR